MAKTSKKTEQSREIIQVTSLDDFCTTLINVEIDLPDGRALAVPMQTLTFKEWHEIGWMVAQPTPPVLNYDMETRRPVFDYNDAGYRRQVDDAQNRRGMMRLAKALQVDIPGDTLEAKAERLTGVMDMNICRQLITLLGNLASDGEARIAARAANFRPAEGAGAENMQPNGVDAEAVDGIG